MHTHTHTCGMLFRHVCRVEVHASWETVNRNISARSGCVCVFVREKDGVAKVQACGIGYVCCKNMNSLSLCLCVCVFLFLLPCGFYCGPLVCVLLRSCVSVPLPVHACVFVCLFVVWVVFPFCVFVCLCVVCLFMCVCACARVCAKERTCW